MPPSLSFCAICTKGFWSRPIAPASDGIHNLLTILTFFIHNSPLCNLHKKIPKYPFKFVQFAYCISPLDVL